MIRKGKTPFAILGMLAREPLSGYDIKRLTECSTQHFWAESYGNLYPTLKKLEAQKLVTHCTEAQTGKPDRKVYSITPAGRKVLLEWLKRPVEFAPPRSELLLKLFFGDQIPLAKTREHLQCFAARERNRLATFTKLKDWLEKEHSNDVRLPFWLSTLSFGQHEAEARIKWAEEILTTLIGKQPKAESSS